MEKMVYTKDNETKGAIRYAPKKDEGVGVLYIHKDALPTPIPVEIRVSVEFYE